jgi:hypothetical protein
MYIRKLHLFARNNNQIKHVHKGIDTNLLIKYNVMEELI